MYKADGYAALHQEIAPIQLISSRQASGGPSRTTAAILCPSQLAVGVLGQEMKEINLTLSVTICIEVD